VGAVTLHQQLGGWKRHIGRVSVFVLPVYRGRGLARALIGEIVQLARNVGLERVEAEFIGEQEAAIECSPCWVQQPPASGGLCEDMQAIYTITFSWG